MKKLLVLGTSLVSSEIVQTAGEMGCYTIVTDNLPPERSRAKLEADEYWMISTGDVDQLEKKCREEHVGAVLAGVSEFNLDRVKELTERLGLPCYIETEPWKYARDKQAFKEKCREIGIPVVEDYVLSDPPLREEVEAVEYPVVIKPVDGAGNKGLSICHNSGELIEACEKARAASGKGKILAERYISGEESWNTYFIAVDEIRCVSRVRAFKQTGNPSYVYSVGISAMEDDREFKEQMDGKCVELLRQIGCRKGIAWVQFIRDEKGRYHAIEMAQRMNAGETTALNERGQGFNPVRWVLDTALGIEHTASMLPRLKKPPYDSVYGIYFLFSDRSGEVGSVKGTDKLDRERFLVSHVAAEGDHVQQYQLLSRVVFSMDSAEDFCDAVRLINETIVIRDETGENMYIRYTDLDVLSERLKGLFLT